MAELSPIQFRIEKTIEWADLQDTFKERMEHAASLKHVPHLMRLVEHPGECAIIGAGPSIQSSSLICKIRQIRESPYGFVMTINGAHNWLLNQGIVPNAHVLFEYDLEDAHTGLGGRPNKAVVYYLSSILNKDIFEELNSHRRVLWHAFLPPLGYQDLVASIFPGEFMIGGGFSSFFRTVSIANALGYRKLHLFGIDCSFDSSSHVEGYGMSDIEPKVKVWTADSQGNPVRQFTTQGGLAFQAKEFMNFCKFNPELSFRVYGDSLLADLHRSSYPHTY